MFNFLAGVQFLIATYSIVKQQLKTLCFNIAYIEHLAIITSSELVILQSALHSNNTSIYFKCLQLLPLWFFNQEKYHI